ncbi:peroxiredoxin [Halotalea alkalilenta]|uniref:peroxiredoxin n=1 Tax=Halotalea alkalilenta TaxID=376489 RepID=UPI0004876A90|nr:peroxiredoxin [Halotalea alkalilenta]
MSLTLNQRLEDFSAPTTGGGTLRLSELAGRQLVLYFYPKDATPGCTTEGLDFSARAERFAAANTLVFGVSRDSLKRHENFKAKQCFAFDLVSDPDETLCRAFDVIKPKKLYGKEYEGIERSTFLIDAEGRLAKEWRKVSVKGHADEVLAAAEALARGEAP